jgi:tetratricopeptide (TPR) repeat protein
MQIRVYLALLLIGVSAQAGELRKCAQPAAQRALEEGMALQAELESESALASYQKCLAIEPGCVACRYESGWSYWKLGGWDEVVKTWEEVLKAEPEHPDIPKYLPAAKENLALLKEKKQPEGFFSGVALGTKSEPAEAPVSMLFLARRESYNPKPADPMDQYDHDIHSPKSVAFTADGKKVYVNSLEAGRTVV